MTDYAAIVGRLDRLDDATRATVASAVGQPIDRETLLGAGQETLAQVERTIDAVVAGGASAANAERPPVDLPELPPANVEPLRARLRNMEDKLRTNCTTTWVEKGLPALVDGFGNPAVIDEATLHAIEEHVASYEVLTDIETRHFIGDRIDALSIGGQVRFHEMCAAQGVSSSGVTTTGRAWVLNQILDYIDNTTTREVADLLGPVASPVADMVPTPVADEAELAAMPPSGKIPEIKAWVGHDPAKARKVIEIETAKAKPRTSLIGAMQIIAGGPGGMPPVAAPRIEGGSAVATVSSDTDSRGGDGPSAPPSADLSGEAGIREDPAPADRGEPSPETLLAEALPPGIERIVDVDRLADKYLDIASPWTDPAELRSALSVMDDFRKDLAQAFRRLADRIEAE